MDNLPNNSEVLEEVEDSTLQEKHKEELSSYSVISFHHIPDQYRSFIYASWLNSLRKGNELYKLIQSDAYYYNYSRFIDALLSRPKIQVNIAVLSDDQDLSLGWSVFEGSTLHYVYVKKELQKNGIAKSLVPNNIKTISHITNVGMTIWNNKLPNAVFNPFL